MENRGHEIIQGILETAKSIAAQKDCDTDFTLMAFAVSDRVLGSLPGDTPISTAVALIIEAITTGILFGAAFERQERTKRGIHVGYISPN